MGGGRVAWWWRRRFWIGVPAVVAGGGAWAALADDKTGWTVVAASAAAVIGAFGPTVADRRARRDQRAGLLREVEFAELPASVAWLLHPARRVVPFFGRGWVLRQLEAWATDPDGTAARLVVGGGGVGKTRLAWHFAGRLDGWDVRSVHVDAESGLADLIAAGDLPDRVLVMVDYAEARDRSALARLLCVAQQTGRARVLLLARHAGLWWETLSAAYPQQAHLVDALTVRAHVLELAAGVEEHGPREIVTDAVAAFAGRLGRPVVPVPDREWDADTPVLRLHAEALVTVLGGHHREGRHDVLAEVLGHETRYWRGAARRAGLIAADDPEPDLVLRQLAGLAALLGADDEEQIADLVARAPLVAGADPQLARRYAGWLGGLYPADRGGLGVLQPDLLAEALAVRMLRECTPAQRTAIVSAVRVEQAVRALTTLGRACAHQDDADELIGTVLAADVPVMCAAVAQVAVQFPGRFTPRMTTLVSGADLDWPLACRLVRQVPHPSVELGRLAVALTTRIVDAFPPSLSADSRAAWIGAHALRLAQVGRPDEALTATREALDMWRELAAGDRDTYLRHLAGAVNSHANRLAKAGRRDEALTAYHEAVDLRRELASADREANLPDLAGVVNNLAVESARTGRRGEALAASQEALDLWRELATANRDTHLRHLAMAVHNHAQRLGEVGRRGEALTTSQEAVALYRELAAGNPDAHLPDLAQSLTNHAARLTEAGHKEEALAAGLEAVNLRRELVAGHPEAHLPGLAQSLSNHAVQMAQMGYLAEALAVGQEAIELRRELVARNRGAHLPDLAQSLNNHAVQMAHVGHREEALAAAREAVELRRELVAGNRGAHLPDLANSLWNVGYVALQLGQADDGAVEATAEGLRYFDELAGTEPAAFGSRRDAVATTLADLHRMAAGRPGEDVPPGHPDG